MSTAAEFFRDIRNTRMCLLYEYLRGLSPHQAQIEMLKACGHKIDLKVITGWFAIFSMNDFDVNLASNTSGVINDDKPGSKYTGDAEKTAKYDEVRRRIQTERPFKPDEESINLLNFFSDLETLKNDERFKVTELEINVRNNAQPKHVLIAVQYSTSAKPQDFLSVEIYHCSNGIVIRRGKQTKLLESAEHYKYYEVARNAVKKLWKTLKVEKEVQGAMREVIEVDFLKLSIDSNDNKPEIVEEQPKPDDHANFFRKLMELLEIEELSDTLGPADLIKFHEKVKVSKELDIKYGECEVDSENPPTQIIKWAEAFLATFHETEDSKVQCVIRTTDNNARVQGLVRNLRFAKVVVEKDKITITRKPGSSSRSSTSSEPGPSPKSEPKSEIPSTSQQSSSSGAAPEPMDQQGSSSSATSNQPGPSPKTEPKSEILSTSQQSSSSGAAPEPMDQQGSSTSAP